MTEEEKLNQFNLTIAEDRKVEPKDWMPEAYRKNGIKANGSACPF
jgi:hypothetical protein